MMKLSESDRFLEEVILSRKPDYKKAAKSNTITDQQQRMIKNEFLPKTVL